jgi:flagellar basal-body rod protein FlgC
MADAMSIAVSGMTAETKRLNASASNVANLRTTGTIPAKDGTVPEGAKQAYQPMATSQTSVMAGSEPAGTRATYTPITPSWVGQMDADMPYADANGMVAAPNVDLAAEQVNQITASRTYAANVATVRTADEMTRDVLNMKA